MGRFITKMLCVAVLVCYSQTVIVAGKNEQPQGVIEIVDLEKNKLIKRVVFNQELHEKMKLMLTGMSQNGRSNLDFPRGILMKVPIHTRVHNEWFDDIIHEAIVIFEPDQQPVVLLFNRKNQPVLFTASGDQGMLNIVVANKAIPESSSVHRVRLGPLTTETVDISQYFPALKRPSISRKVL